MHQWVEDYLLAKQQDRSDEERRRLMNAATPSTRCAIIWPNWP